MKAARILSIVWLALGAVLAVGALLFSILMEGMRHSKPVGFDAYYWTAGIPLGLSACWLVVAFARSRSAALITLSVFAAAASIWWLSLLRSEGIGVLIVCSTWLAMSFAACRLVQQSSNRESQKA